MTSPNQATLNAPVSFEGAGIHTGTEGSVVVKPAPPGTGRLFVTNDGTEIPARVDHVVACDRCTVLGKGDARVHTPEHLLAALWGAGVDNARIEMTGPEVPILDGSCETFHREFLKVGVADQKEPAAVLVPERPYTVSTEAGQLVLVVPDDHLHFEYVLYYDHPMLGCQTVQYDPSSGDFEQEIAPARTFALWEEVKPLLERGLAQGGNINNALVVFQDKFSTPLTVEREPVRHKCLDLIGDFALLDARLRARVLAVMAGHRLHVDCAQLLWEDLRG